MQIKSELFANIFCMNHLSKNIRHLVDISEKSQDAFGEIFGLKRGAVGSYINEVAVPKIETLQKISEFSGFSIDQLINFDISNENILKPIRNGLIGVPYYDIDITATITESFNDVKEVPEFYVDFRPFNDCTAYLPIFGDSMYPTFASGEIIAVKRLNNPEIILWGEAYLIITNELANNMKTVKLLFPHEEPDKIILRASNPNFKGDTIIPKDSILNLYIVKGKITRKQL